MIEVVYFSVLRERLGEREEIEFRGRIGELRELLKNRHPDVAGLIDMVRFAVNEEYVKEDYVLEGNEQVAVIPPVSGG